MFKKIWNWLFPKIVFAEYHGNTLRVRWSNGYNEAFQGSCTVWHRLPGIKRCGTFEEGKLSEIWHYIEYWGNDYPDAHLKKSKKTS